MKKILIVVLVFFSLISFSQDFGELGSTWHFTKHYSFSSSKSYVKVESINDTVIMGKNCHQLSLTGGGLCNFDSPTVFVYTEDSVVYFMTKDSNIFQVLYDFTTKKDSSWTIKYYQETRSREYSVYVKVDSIGVKVINSQKLRLLYVTYYETPQFSGYSYSSEIVEKIGDINWMFNWYVCIDGQNAGGLRCYRDPSFGVYTTWIAPSCTFTRVSEYYEKSLLQIYPNPTNSNLNIELRDNSTYQILDINGRILQKSSLLKGKNSIDVQQLKAGMYILQIENQGAISSYKFLKE